MDFQMLPNLLKFQNRGRECLREIINFSYESLFIHLGCYNPLPNRYKITNLTLGEMAPNILQMKLNWVRWIKILNWWHETCNIHKLHSVINNQHYHDKHQYSGEMVIVCSLIITVTYNHLVFRPDTLWRWIK